MTERMPDVAREGGRELPAVPSGAVTPTGEAAPAGPIVLELPVESGAGRLGDDRPPNPADADTGRRSPAPSIAAAAPTRTAAAAGPTPSVLPSGDAGEFLDVSQGLSLAGGSKTQVLPAAPPPAEMTAEAGAADGPVLLDLPEQDGEGRLGADWAPAPTRPVRRRGVSSLSWLAMGVVLALLGWTTLSMAGFVHDQFARSARLGWLSLAVFLIATGLVLTGVLIETRSYRRLRQVDTLRAALARPDLPLAEAQALCRAWLNTVASRLSDPEAARRALQAASTLAETRAVLRARVLAPLEQAARQAARHAAMQGGAVVAIVPSPALDGVFTGLRGLALVRQVARLYGLRPGLATSLALLRRLAWTAASVSGLDLLTQSVTNHALDKLPVVKHIANAVPATATAARRLYSLGLVTAKACSPLDDA